MKLFVLFNVLFLILCVFAGRGLCALNFGFANIVESAKDVTTGVAKDFANKLPTPRGLFDSSKQLIAGYPLEFVMSSINAMCKFNIVIIKEKTFKKGTIKISECDTSVIFNYSYL